VRGPTRERRCQLLGFLRIDIQKTVAGTATQPFQRPADDCVHAPLRDLKWQGANRVERVEDHERTNLLRLLDDRLDVDNRRTAEHHVVDRNQQRGVIDVRSELLAIR